MATETWAELHDATLESLELRWSSGEAVLRIRTGNAMHPQRILVASAVRRLDCDRQMPWGFSVSKSSGMSPMRAGKMPPEAPPGR